MKLTIPLEDYLISNEIGDFRIAFALWGTIFGFANMPKTLTNNLFLSGNRNYISEIYKYIFKQVHGIDLEGELERKREIEYITTEHSNINSLEQELLEFGEFISRDEKTKKEIITKLNEIGIYSLSDWNDKVESIKWTTSKGQRKLVTVIKKSKQKKGSIPFPEEKLERKDFYENENIFKYLESVLPNDERIKTQFKVDLDWFQNEYKKGSSSKYYEKASRDNIRVIESFNRYIAKKEYADKLIDQIIVRLKELYLQNER